jgi:hypothetical protein
VCWLTFSRNRRISSSHNLSFNHYVRKHFKLVYGNFNHLYNVSSIHLHALLCVGVRRPPVKCSVLARSWRSTDLCRPIRCLMLRHPMKRHIPRNMFYMYVNVPVSLSNCLIPSISAVKMVSCDLDLLSVCEWSRVGVAHFHICNLRIATDGKPLLPHRLPRRSVSGHSPTHSATQLYVLLACCYGWERQLLCRIVANWQIDFMMSRHNLSEENDLGNP